MSEPNSTAPNIKKPEDRTWHPQQAKLLKGWAEIASSYRWMHNQAYMIYKRKNLFFMIPLIVMSTLTGTANFAQNSFPAIIRPNIPQIIGAINLISAIMTTIYNFLKISEFMESHRISSINYGKLARNITVELNLPVKDRTTGGADCVKTSRMEIDRLIEQSPAIPKHVLGNYESLFSGKGLSEPEIVVINKVDVYEDLDNKMATTIAEAGMKLKNALNIKKKTALTNLFKGNTSESSKKLVKERINDELEELGTSKLVSRFSVKPLLEKLMGATKPSQKTQEGLPVFPTEIEEGMIINMPSSQPQSPTRQSPPSETSEQDSNAAHDIVHQPVDEIMNEIIDNVVEESVTPTTLSVQDELEQLKNIKIVSGNKQS
jgi:hypothetical protein